MAMIAFEAFNYGTTAYALRDLLGDLRFAGFQWATLMALAFCGIDFAGIARLITQKGREGDRRESWYLFGAWLIAATFNAALTWWGVAIAISNHTTASAAFVSSRVPHHHCSIVCRHSGLGHPHPDHWFSFQRSGTNLPRNQLSSNQQATGYPAPHLFTLNGFPPCGRVSTPGSLQPPRSINCCPAAAGGNLPQLHISK